MQADGELPDDTERLFAGPGIDDDHLERERNLLPKDLGEAGP
jgi:hypothetical protein